MHSDMTRDNFFSLVLTEKRNYESRERWVEWNKIVINGWDRWNWSRWERTKLRVRPSRANRERTISFEMKWKTNQKCIVIWNWYVNSFLKTSRFYQRIIGKYSISLFTQLKIGEVANKKKMKILRKIYHESHKRKDKCISIFRIKTNWMRLNEYSQVCFPILTYN